MCAYGVGSYFHCLPSCSNFNFQICIFMTGLAAVVLVGAYLGKEIKSLVIFSFSFSLFHFVINY